MLQTANPVDVLAQAISKALSPVIATKAGTAASSPVGPMLHGPGGFFSTSGLESDLFSTVVRPMGLGAVLPALPTRYLHPRFGYLTGITAATGNVPDAVCDDPQTAGHIKTCIQSAQFGRFSFQTATVEATAIGQLEHRGEFDDIMLLNPITMQDGPFSMQMANTAGGSLSAATEMKWRMMALGVAFERLMADKLWTGNPANDSTNKGYREFPGLEMLVSTTKVDAETGDPCPSLASDVKNFNYKLVTAYGEEFITAMTYLNRYLRFNATRMGFGDVQWVIVMNPVAFYEVSAAWACSYLTSRCQTAATNTQASFVVDVTDQRRFLDEMRTPGSEYLLIDGVKVPVILDDGIPEDTPANNASVPQGSFSSDIYFLPLTVLGGRPVLYWQYFDYNEGALEAAQQFGGGPSWFVLDNGKFMWHMKTPINWCIQAEALVQPRIVLRTPHLAGRLQNVRYMPLQHTRSPFPGDPYEVDGGVSTARPITEVYGEWNLPD